MTKGILLLVLLAMAGCGSSPPKPVSCDGATKRPVNQSQQQKTVANPASYVNCV